MFIFLRTVQQYFWVEQTVWWHFRVQSTVQCVPYRDVFKFSWLHGIFFKFCWMYSDKFVTFKKLKLNVATECDVPSTVSVVSKGFALFSDHCIWPPCNIQCVMIPSCLPHMLLYFGVTIRSTGISTESLATSSGEFWLNREFLNMIHLEFYFKKKNMNLSTVSLEKETTK